MKATTHLNCGEDNFLDGAEILIPQELCLLPHGKYVGLGDRSEHLRHLHQQSLVGLDDGLVPVDDLGEGEPPAVGQEDGKAAGLQRLDEPERTQAATARHQAKGGVLQQVVVVPPEIESWRDDVLGLCSSSTSGFF